MRFGLLEAPRSVSDAVHTARLAEQAGFSLIGVADSQSVFRELYVTLAAIATETTNIRLGPTVTNPLTRHPAVTASAIATLDELSDGRAIVGLGTGDSAVLNLALDPARLSDLRTYGTALKELLVGESIELDGKQIHTQWASSTSPLFLAAEGPRTLELAGEMADGVICGMGLSDELISKSLHHIKKGAEKAGRQLSDIELWALARVNVGDNKGALRREIRQELASSAHHAFRATLDGKQVPERFLDVIETVQHGYETRAHEDLGDSLNARLMTDDDFLEYMSWRFAVIGTPDECGQRLSEISDAGIDNVLFTGFVEDRGGLLEELGRSVLPGLAEQGVKKERADV